MSAKVQWVEEPAPVFGPVEPSCVLGFDGHTWTLHIEEGRASLVQGEPCQGRSGSCIDWVEPEELNGEIGPVTLSSHVERQADEVYGWVEIRPGGAA